MDNSSLATELRAISQELDQILANEEAAANESRRRFDEESGAIEKLLQSVEEAKRDGRWRNTRSNIFDLLGQSHLEEAHTRFLEWLLNPAESHGFGNAFLLEFLRRAIGGEPPSTEDVWVKREHECGDSRFDVYVEGDRWRLVVENKIHASAGEQQGSDYESYCQRVKNCGEQAWLVYVTRPDRRPSNETIPWLSYREIRQILESLTPDPSAAMAIEHFCEHVISDLEV